MSPPLTLVLSILTFYLLPFPFPPLPRATVLGLTKRKTMFSQLVYVRDWGLLFSATGPTHTRQEVYDRQCSIIYNQVLDVRSDSYNYNKFQQVRYGAPGTELKESKKHSVH